MLGKVSVSHPKKHRLSCQAFFAISYEALHTERMKHFIRTDISSAYGAYEALHTRRPLNIYWSILKSHDKLYKNGQLAKYHPW